MKEIIEQSSIIHKNNLLKPNPLENEVFCPHIAFALAVIIILTVLKVFWKTATMRISKDCDPLNNKSEFAHDDDSNPSLQKNLKKHQQERILSSKPTSSFTLLKIAILYGLLLSFPKPIEGSRGFLTSNPLTSSQESLVGSKVPLYDDPHYEISNGSPRMPEEISKSPSVGLSKPISLAIGKVLSLLSIYPDSIVLSKDRNRAFVSLIDSGAIKVLDVSNVESPTVMTTIRLQPLDPYSPSKALVLSDDEKTLFASNMRYFEIIDVSNFGLPVLLARLEDINLPRNESISKNRTSIALAKDKKTLFVAGSGLQVIDILDLKKPKIISSNSEELKATNLDEYFREVRYCEKREILYIAGNKTLNISDARNPRDLKLMGSYSSPYYSIESVLISKKNHQEIFVLGKEESQMILKKINVTNPSANLEVIESYKLDYDSSSFSSLLSSSSDDNMIFFQNGITLGIFNIEENILKLLALPDDIKRYTYPVTSIVISKDDSTIMIASPRGFQILELYKNYPNSRIFTLSQNVIGSLNLKTDNSPTDDKYTNISMSSLYLTSDEKVLFIQKSRWSLFQRHQASALALDVVNISDPLNPRLISSIKDTFKLTQIKILEKAKRAYLVSPDGVAMLDISDLRALRFVGKFKQVPIGEIEFADYSSDGSKGYIISNSNQNSRCVLMIIDLSDEESKEIKVFGEIDLVDSSPSISLLTKKEDIMYLGGRTITIYNVSEPENPRQISSSISDFDGGRAIAKSMMLSDDEKTLFVYVDADGRSHLAIYDVHVASSITFLGSLPVPSRFFREEVKLRFSSDRKLIYFNGQYGDVLTINISNYTSPFVQGIFKVYNRRENENDRVQDLIFSEDCKTAFFFVNEGLRIANIEVLHTLYLGTESIKLGQDYSHPVVLFQLDNDTRRYEVFNEKSKFIKISLFDLKINPAKPSPELNFISLPNWITFEKESQMLTIEPQKQLNLGSHTLFSAFSTKIPEDAFMSLMNNDKKKSQDLVTTLIIRGYLDDEMFLTSNFDNKKDLILPSEYSDYKDLIFSTLQRYYFETWTTFDILPSLDVRFENSGKISVDTLSSNAMRVDIQLLDDHGRFLNKPYGLLHPIVTENSSRIVLEGPMNEINYALKNLVIDLETHEAKCDGTIVIWDRLNSIFSQTVENIDRFFKINKVPTMKLSSIQEVIDTKPIYTGEYFTVDFQKEAFTDQYNSELSYEIAMMENAEKGVPTWISFSNMSLHGTPPEELFGREMRFYLIVKNEFKSVKEPFVLKINISLKFALKLLKQYGPYILTIIGLIVYANKIYNVLCKRRYRYPGDFKVEIGEEMNIPMIAFIGQEKKEADVILKQLRLLISRELKRGSIKNIDLARYFLDQDGLRLEKIKLRKKISQVIKDSKENLVLYNQKAGKELIQQLIFNQLCLWYLDSDKGTKKIFDDIKGEWAELVDWNGSAICNAKENRLNELIAEGEDPNHDSSKEKLISRNVNLGLLKDTIEAYAMKNQHIDYPAIRARIVIKEKVGKNIFKKLLKLNLKDIHFSDKGKMGYGMNYKIEDDKLSFYGIPKERFEGKTMIVQITRKRHRILKELWLHGVSKVRYPSDDEEEAQEIPEKSETHARGQEYEIY